MLETIYQLSEDIDFPPLDSALTDPNGLLAVGGDLSPKRLLSAYQQGIFPWFSDGDPILWWSPNPRAVIFPEKIKISRSLQKSIRNKNFSITENQAFVAVIHQCAATRKHQDETWITQPMIEAYIQLHQDGHAKSIEVWHGKQLVGGLYGIQLGQVFSGESMFSLQSDASKVALAHLAKTQGYQLIDCQIMNPHLETLGAEYIDREEFTLYLPKKF